MRMLDLFAGLGGASAAMKDRGWEVITVEINPEFKPDIVEDIKDFHYSGEPVDLIWASPPCTEFSKTSFPPSWYPNLSEPSLDLLQHARRVISEVKPQFWIIENVRGAVKYFSPIMGIPVKVIGSRYLWGEFPIFNAKPAYGKWKLWGSISAPKRSLIPYDLSLNLALAIEHYNESDAPHAEAQAKRGGASDNDGR